MDTPNIRQLRKTVESLMRTYDDFSHATVSEYGIVVTLNSGRLVEIEIRDHKSAAYQ
jgi:hypothetical protein